MHHELVFVDISLRTYVHVREFGVQCFRKYCVSQSKITPGVKPNRLSVKRKKEKKKPVSALPRIKVGIRINYGWTLDGTQTSFIKMSVILNFGGKK